MKTLFALRAAGATLAMAAASFSGSAVAKERPAKSYFKECPVESTIRVANARASERYAALNNCVDRIVHVEPAPLPELPSTARITGVREEDNDRAARRNRARRGAEPISYQYSPSQYSRSAARGVAMGAHNDHITRAASAYRVDPLFLRAIIATESGYDSNAVSRVGARGLMQIMPATGRTLGVESSSLFRPDVNVDAGARLLKRLQRRYGRNFSLILGAYNAGEGAVARYGNTVPPYRETQDYVRKVMGRYHSYRASGVAR